jgi:SAM-dependent methyltransferase
MHLAQLRAHYRVEGVDASAAMVDVARRRLPGVPLHVGDMATLALGRRFDAVTCLFSAVGFMTTPERLRAAVRAMARHLVPGGVLIVEPWLSPEVFEAGRLFSDVVDEPGRKIVRVGVTRLEGRVSVLDMHHVVATPEAIEHFDERLELRLHSADEYRAAFAAAGLDLVDVAEDLTGRGLYVGVAGDTAEGADAMDVVPSAEPFELH